MKFRQTTYFRFLAFLTLVLCAPMNVLAAGPYVWCMGPHDHAVIESNATKAHHGGHHHDINDAAIIDAVPLSDASHDDVHDCIDFSLGQDGQLNAPVAASLAPELIDQPCHLGTTLLSALFSQPPPLATRVHGPPKIGAIPIEPLVTQHPVILLI